MQNNESTITLLEKCNAGCKSATNSMEQVIPYIQNEDLKKLIQHYNNQHVQLGEETHNLLNQYNEEEKDPNLLAKVFSWISTEVKLMMNDDSNEIAKLMMDGCNMGIQSISQSVNENKNASKESIGIAKKLIKIEEEFMLELKAYL